MRGTSFMILLALGVLATSTAAQKSRSAAFTVNQVRSYPFPNELTAAATGARIAWAFNEQGKRNIFVAEGPAFAVRQLTHYDRDDGQELSSVAIAANGRWVVYVRGGDHGSNWDDELPVNVGASPEPPKVQIFSVPFDGGDAKAIADGAQPVISPRSDVVAFVKGGQIWTVPIDGSAPAKAVVTVRGQCEDLRWSPNGSRLAFDVDRGDHSFIGVYTNDSTAILWLAPSFTRDWSPRWSPDGRQVAFARTDGAGGAPDSALSRHPRPWEIWIADATTGAAQRLWKSPETLAGSIPTTEGGTNLNWAAGGRIVFLSYQDGWPHLYSIPASGGTALLLTPGRYMAEHISLSSDGRWLVFAGNMGDSIDVDRRHVVRVPVDRGAPEVVTPGSGLEWAPTITGDGATIVFISATAQRPPLPAVKPFMDARAAVRTLAADHIPADFPTGLVTPRQVVFRSVDGLTIHGQLFETVGGAATRKPAVVYVHGGPPRQMLLGWHYSDYYSNAYALNQYFASRGFIVLSVNYRLGIGYGYEFHQAPHSGSRGAAEYRDIQAAAVYLRSLPRVDTSRIGIYGGSYGGFLTALALARNSDVFAAGVDIHGVHDWTAQGARGLLERDSYEQAPDVTAALDTAWRSSPASSVSGWKSPVLIIHGDDDRNVRFSQSTDLVRRLAAASVPFETLVIPDDTHHFLRYANILTVDRATAEFLERQLIQSNAAGARATGRQ